MIKKHKLAFVLLGGSVLILTAILIFAFIINRWTITITMNGNPSVQLEYGETYTDPGATAYFHGSLLCKKGWSVPVTVKNNVDVSKTGEYEVTYSAEKYHWSAQCQRAVSIADTIAPTITLTSNPDSYTLPGDSYIEEGYSANDNYDGDITANVTSEEKDGVITYTVADSAGNETTATRKINYMDPIPPELSLNGEKNISISAGSSYSEPGWTASDNCDGDLTGQVTISGNVDIYRAGTYELTYTATDSYGNSTSDTRNITVTPIRQASTVVPDGKIIYLTFDDGPGPYTQQLLDILSQYNVKATFFVKSSEYNYLIASEAAAGHSVGIHSTTHNYAAIYASEDAFFQDFHQMESIIAAQTGSNPTICRFPGGGSNQVSAKYCSGIMTALTHAVVDQGYQYFDWNVSSGDAGGTTDTETVFQNVINGVQKQNISIVLQHDIKGFSVNAVEKIIVWGLANGYTFLPLDASSPAIHHPVAN